MHNGNQFYNVNQGYAASNNMNPVNYHGIYTPTNSVGSSQQNLAGIYNPVNVYGNMDGFNEKNNLNSHGIDDDIPLLEELEIDIGQIIKKTVLVLLPFKETEVDPINDADLGGPILYCLAFGFLLFLSGKFSGFGVVYAISVIGSLLLFALVNLMSNKHLPLYSVTCIFGYSLIPMIFLAMLSLVFKLTTPYGLFLTFLMILWSSISSTKLIVKAMDDRNKFLLICYPCFMLFAIFAIITLFQY